ncbi:MAG TPA: protein kinase, partial [Planctomycetota bacterium]|nr:protein kinase [Planctomycetota bacterium]
MKVGPYEVLSELGRGGMGVVYRARSAAGDDVAVKVLHESDESALARFERERRILGLFTARDGFVPLVDAGMSDKGPYLVMPFVPG